jgi:cobyrinic acid a,c-diamide synthase
MDSPTGITQRPPVPSAGARRINALAIVSLVSGVASFALGFIVVGAVVAIVTGHVARRQIKRSAERGAPLALIGLILGYTHIVLDLSYLGLLLFAWIAGHR